ncbi:von Willebrand factor, type A [gamma proteobacterium HTCC5015]|nr:von Willebrand factor, type A [gamma proteobacterium HTCC5015]
MCLALVLPLLVHALPARQPRAKGRALKVPNTRWFAHSVDSHSGVSPSPPHKRWYWLLAALGYIALVVAAMRPLWVGEPVAMPREGRALVVALDISGSMEEQDMDDNGQRRSRIAVTKDVAMDFVKQREGDRIALVLFGTHPYLQTPLTFDHPTVMQHIYEAQLTMADDLQRGIHATAIGDAIGLAVKRLRDIDAPDKTLILLTDGSDNASQVAPLKAAQIAAREGLKIYTIGLGAEQRQASLLGFDFGFGKNREIDEKTLKDIAKATDGRYFRARNPEELREIYQHIDRLEPSEAEAEYFRPERSLFHWPLSLSVVLFALWGAVRWRDDIQHGEAA